MMSDMARGETADEIRRGIIEDAAAESPMRLGQQELVAPAPVRRLVVPAGHGAWWGADWSTLRLALAFVDGEGRRGVATAPFAPVAGAGRLDEIYAQTRSFVWRLMQAGWPAPGILMGEQPSGSNQQVNLSLIYAVGAMQAALYASLRDCFSGVPVHMETCVAAHWKLVACGRGNIYKPTRKRLGRAPVFEDYGVAVWARANGYAGSSWDEADALGIAVAASREIALEQR
jgi:hypothetical protein